MLTYVLSVRPRHVVGLCLLMGGLASFSCSDSSNSSNSSNDGSRTALQEKTGAACEVADDCFTDLEVMGTAQCLDRVRDGYCTHSCTADTDCCAVDGECPLNTNQVCAPFESTGQMMCFLSCGKESIQATQTKYDDDNAFCQGEVSPDFICRSSGGGANNKKICVPGDCGVGANCASDADCSSGLSCLSRFNNGYCSVDNCASDADCPGGSACVRSGDNAACMKRCSTTSECTFCRGDSATCKQDVDLIDGSKDSVCVIE